MFELLTATLLWGVNMRHCATFRSAQSNCCGDMAIFHFLRWQPSAILDLYYVYLDHHQRVLVGLCQCAIFGWNRCSSFDNKPVSMFRKFGLIMPIHCHFSAVFRGFDPLDGPQYQPNFHKLNLWIITVLAAYKLCLYA